MTNTSNLNSVSSPGVYISEVTFGAIPQGLSLHNTVYFLVYSATADANTHDAFQYVNSLNDFNNRYPASLSGKSVEAFFSEKPGMGCMVLNVKPRDTQSIEVSVATPAVVYSLTIDGFSVSHTATAADTVLTIREALGAKVNNVFTSVSYLDGFLRIRGTSVITVSPEITLGSLVENVVYPTAVDVRDSLEVLNTESPKGFLLAPEFFSTPSLLTANYQLLVSYLESKADEIGCVSIIDCSLVTATSPDLGIFGINAASERAFLASPKGNSVYYAPYIKNNNDVLVPPSGCVAGVWLKRMRIEGFNQPPAGVSYPLVGVKGMSIDLNRGIQDTLNPLGINLIRLIPNKGYCIWGARTLSTNPYYRFVTTRVILNVLRDTLLRAYDELLFSSIDGLGVVFSRIQQTAITVCERLRLGGALYGATPQDAYLCLCDTSNNTTELNDGRVNLDVFVKVSPILEMLMITLRPTAIGVALGAASTGLTETQPESTTPTPS